MSEKDKNKLAGKTITGRKIFGGDGIAPDETTKNPNLNNTQISLLDPIFFFSKELANGRIEGFENYKTGAKIKYGQRIRPVDFVITDDLINAFNNLQFGNGNCRRAKFKAKNHTLNRVCVIIWQQRLTEASRQIRF